MNVTPDHTSTNCQADGLPGFCSKLTGALAELKERLQDRYQRSLPGRAELLRKIIDGAEARAWELSLFPHLFLPDLVELRIAELALQPAFARSEAAFAHAA